MRYSLNITQIDDPYQTLAKPEVDFQSISGPKHKEIEDLHQQGKKERVKSNTLYSSWNNRWSIGMRDYDYTTTKKRISNNAKQIITIYENDKRVSYLQSTQGSKKLIEHRSSSKKRFLSNRSLIGVRDNTKELTRMMNRSSQD